MNIEQWDMISKQPMFKSGAVRVEKANVANGEVKIHEQQSVSVSFVEKEKANAVDVADKTKHERHLPYWLGSTFESIEVLIDIYKRVLPQLMTDKELHASIETLRGIAEAMVYQLKPYVEKYGENKKYGRKVSEALKDVLFPERDASLGSYETLATLQALKMWYAHIDGHLLALQPTSKASWDKGFIDAVAYCQHQIGRLTAWADEHLKVKSPQTLLVPDRGFRGLSIFEDNNGVEGDGDPRGHMGEAEKTDAGYIMKMEAHQ